MKIYMYVNVDWFFFSHRLSIAKEARRQGCDFQVYAELTARGRALQKSGYSVSESTIRRSSSLIRTLVEFLRTYLYLRGQNVDILHAVTLKPILIVGLCARLLKLSFVASISGLGPGFSQNNIGEYLRRAFIVVCYRLIFSSEKSRVVCQSEHDMNMLINLGVATRDQITLVRGSGVDLKKFTPREVHDQLRDKIHVLMASRLLEDKGVLEYIAAAARLNNQEIPATFFLAGPTDEDSPSGLDETIVRKLCEDAGVTYLGNSDDMSSTLKEADVFAYPSYYAEGLPKVLLEAAATGLPIVTTDHPGCRDAIKANVTGLLVAVKSIDELAQALIYLCEREEKIRELGRAARLLAESEFDERVVVAKHYQIYKALSPVGMRQVK